MFARLRSHVSSGRVSVQVFLVFGKSGWIGGLIGQLLKERGLKFEYANARLEDRSEVIADLERVKTCTAYRKWVHHPLLHRFKRQPRLADQACRSVMIAVTVAGQANTCAECCRTHWKAKCGLV